MLALPAQPVRPGTPGVVRSWGMVLGNRPFLVLALAGSAYFTLFNQLYLAVPVEAARVTGRPEAVGVLLVVFSLIEILRQVRITAFFRRRMSAGAAMAVGTALMGTAFVPLAIAAPWQPTAEAELPQGAAAVALLPLVIAVVLLSVGTAVVAPFAVSLIAVVGEERLLATYYGWFYLVCAVAATAVSAVTGTLLDRDGVRAAPFVLLVLVGAMSTGLVLALLGRGHLDDPQTRVQTATPR